MSRRRRVTRPKSEWVIRGLLALFLVGVGILTVPRTLAFAMRSGNPALAHRLAPGDGRITAVLSSVMAGPGATSKERAEAGRLAQRAVRQDPTAVLAVSTLGLNAQVRGDNAGATRLFGYAEILSRRDLQSQIWAIENSVALGNVAQAIRHYDIALRTSRDAPDLLFPVLANAIDDAAIRRALVPTLAQRPVWMDGFIAFVAGRRENPAAAASLFHALSQARVTISQTAQTGVVNNLVTNGDIDDAWRYYATIRPGVTRQRSRDPDFTANLETPSLFDWSVVNDTGISSSIQRGEQGGVVEFSAASGVGGPLLRQMQFLPPGRYRIVGQSSNIDQPDDALPYWSLRCDQERELGRVVIPVSRTRGGRFAGDIDVPADCPIQYLTLQARPSDRPAGLAGQIDNFRLEAAR